MPTGFATFRVRLYRAFINLSLFLFGHRSSRRTIEVLLFYESKIGHKKQRQERAAARARGELPPWTGPRLPRAHHSTPEGRREASQRPPIDPYLPLPPVTKSAEQIWRERTEFAQQRKDAREGKISAFESLIRANENVLTIAQLKEALKPKYYGDIRYKPVEGAPPGGSAPPPATQQPEGATSLPEKIEEGATIQPGNAVGGATYLRGSIDRPLEGVKKKLSAAKLSSRCATLEVEEKGEKVEEKEEEKCEEKEEESWEEIDSITEAEIEEDLNRVRRRGPGLKDW